MSREGFDPDVMWVKVYALPEVGEPVLVASYPTHLDETAEEIAREYGNTDLDDEADTQLLYDLAPEGSLKELAGRLLTVIAEDAT